MRDKLEARFNLEAGSLNNSEYKKPLRDAIQKFAVRVFRVCGVLEILNLSLQEEEENDEVSDSEAKVAPVRAETRLDAFHSYANLLLRLLALNQ